MIGVSSDAYETRNKLENTPSKLKEAVLDLVVPFTEAGKKGKGEMLEV